MKKLGGTYRIEISFLDSIKNVLLHNFETTGPIQLILLPLEQKSSTITRRLNVVFAENQQRKFSSFFLVKPLVFEDKPF